MIFWIVQTEENTGQVVVVYVDFRPGLNCRFAHASAGVQ